MGKPGIGLSRCMAGKKNKHKWEEEKCGEVDREKCDAPAREGLVQSLLIERDQKADTKHKANSTRYYIFTSGECTAKRKKLHLRGVFSKV